MSSNPTPPHLRRQRSWRRRTVAFFRENMVEIATAVVLVAAGILYLVYSPRLTKLPQTANEWAHILIAPLGEGRDWLIDQVKSPLFFDILLAAIVGFILVLISLRVRHRFLYSKTWRSRNCPRCGEHTERVHRNFIDRAIAPIFLPHARRFRCTKCGWEGLRYGRSSGHHRRVEEPHETQESS